ncbi:MAG TPA: hypothetical protein QGG30_05945 [Acidobacteriota bacterium]|nr:hypothetical protein [Acidobacteriota bacterium]
MNRDNWFLVLPTFVLGIVASYTLYQMHAAGDARRAIEIVAEYEAAGQPPLGEFLARRGPLAWETEVVSNFYGTMEVACIVGPTNNLERFAWRVHVMQKVFAPADASTRTLMGEYQPDLFGSLSEKTQANVPLGAFSMTRVSLE